jgi:peptidylprolyl isomerase
MITRPWTLLFAACMAAWAAAAHSAADTTPTTAPAAAAIATGAVTASNPTTTTTMNSTTAEADATTVAAAGAATTSPSVTIIDTKAGEGPEVENGKTVQLHYDLTLANGTRIDSSRDKIVPTPFTVVIGEGKSIKGFELGLMGMKPGGIRTIIIPPELGYGPAGRGKDIPPNATLRFEVEAISVK